jgi:hypothetical protein
MKQHFNKIENIMKDENFVDVNKNIDFIKDAVAYFYGQDRSVYDQKSRKSNFMKVKHIAIYICTKNLNITQVELGKAFNCSHSLIIYVGKTYEGYLKFDNDLKKQLTDIQNILNFKLAGELNLQKENYYIPLNEFVSMKNENGKAILLKGFTEDEIRRIDIVDRDSRQSLFEPTEAKYHKNQKFYILEKKYNEKNDNFNSSI